ncbi:pyrroloquinoline quinone biosynthesis protein PqqB [Anderseniella sp. Alg231-50]|uniref:pyrroloquinoline quinone biosynthesis protein PqqB n=1 Tax=Anderseniella sp. Alg231-50 TaxID=1922226 RepID=UPI000D554AFC
MKLKIIGSAAGGGFPQWNCNYRLSREVRAARTGLTPRSQSSIAASADGANWVLFNASPDIREQISNTPELQPDTDGALRNSPIKAVVLTNADVDHIAGLLTLREKQAFNLYASTRILDTLANNPIFRVLDETLVNRIELPLGGTTQIEGPDGPLGIEIETYAVPGKIALFLEDNSDPVNFGSDDGDTIGVRIAEPGADAGAAVHYIPGCARVTDELRSRISGAGCLLFDGTVFTDTEMPDAGVGAKTGARMGHIAMSGDEGSLASLKDVDVARRVFVHINNTNPVLDPASPEREVVARAGWEVGHDGQEVEL